jgi:HEAT repeat protein
MLSSDQIRTLARASAWWATFEDQQSAKPYDERIRNLALESLGNPGTEELITSGLAALGSDDRNLRVAALRILRFHLGDQRVIDAVLAATRDPKRRVRRIAVHFCSMLVDRRGVPERLREIVDDPDETNKISSEALFALAGRVPSSAAAGAPAPTLRVVSDLLRSEEHRERIFMHLLAQRPDDSTRDLLQEVVRTGSKAEAVAATRALCGQLIVNLAHFLPEDRKRVQDECDPVDLSFVSGRGYVNASLYWIASNELGVRDGPVRSLRKIDPVG